MSNRVFTLLGALLLVATASAQEVKSIIYLIGDGMSLAAVSMMQLENRYEATIFDRAENVALQKTYSADNRITDSAASGTALATGYKTNNTYVGMLPDGTAVESLMERASKRGMATGVIVTTYLQHATPAAFYAHVMSRSDYLTITRQLTSSRLDVAIGGGSHYFEECYGKNFRGMLQEQGITLATSLEEVRRADSRQRVIALIDEYEVTARTDEYLAEAMHEAIRIMEQKAEDRGFVLMVEGSIIDGMGHANDAHAMQGEMRGFMRAVEYAVEYASQHDDTLVVVTADHETGGLTLVSSDADFTLAEQGVEYRWTTTGHAGAMVPIYLYGAGCEEINGIMENSELGARLMDIISK